jgi:hypothetical protein
MLKWAKLSGKLLLSLRIFGKKLVILIQHEERGKSMFSINLQTDDHKFYSSTINFTTDQYFHDRI